MDFEEYNTCRWYPFPEEPILGIDLDGKKVINGVTIFQVVDAHGFPLEMALDACHKNGCVIHWPTFVMKASLAGWNANTIYARIVESLNMVYRDEVKERKLIERLDTLFEFLTLKVKQK